MLTLTLSFFCFLSVLQGAVLGSNKPHYDLDHALDHFIEFVMKYDKKYEYGETSVRFENFVKTLELINKRNKNASTVTHDINKFADMSSAEFASNMYGFRLTGTLPPSPKPYEGNFTAPDSIDWRNKNAVTPVKNQGLHCGSCWAFSAVATIEGQYAKKHSLQSFSEQQIVDCDTNEGGCGGGDPQKAFVYVQTAGGLEYESDYPYLAKQSTCSFDASKAVAIVTNAPAAVAISEEELAEKVASYGPVSVAFCALGLFTYNNGIFDGAECQGHTLENCLDSKRKSNGHAVTIVGYGSDQGTPYWLIKNSWGANWGENGYFRMKRGESLCAINSHVSTAEVA